MDAGRFDALSRSFASRASRRQAIGRLGAGGVTAGVLAAFGIRSTVAAADTTCELDVTATVAIGSDKETEFSGRLTLPIDADGAIDDATFETDEGDTFDVVGQAVGRAISLRVDLGDGTFLLMNGTAERDLVLCRGRVDGTFGGPEIDDLGTWTAKKAAKNSQSGQSGQSPTPVSSGNSNSNGNGSTNNSGGTGNGNGSGSGGTSGGSGNSGGNSSCPSGVVCGGTCCTPREGYSPDQIYCDGDYCTCSYSCVTTGCTYGDDSTFIAIGCDDRPDALCGEFCFDPNANDDDGSGSGGAGGGADATSCDGGQTNCAGYAPYEPDHLDCRADVCICTYSCASAQCPNADETSYMSIDCTQNPNSLCANFGCG